MARQPVHYDVSDMKKLERALITFGKTGIIIANRRALNDTVVKLRKLTTANLERVFELRRERFMKASIRFRKA